MGGDSLKVVALLSIMGLALSHCARYPHLRPGETYLYQFMRRGVQIGTEAFSVEKTGKHLVLKSEINIAEGKRYQRGNSEMVLRENGEPVAYSRRLEVNFPELPAQNGVWELKYVFHGKKVTGGVTKDGFPQWRGTIEVEKGVFHCIDNNALSLLSLLVKAIYPDLREETVYSVKAVHFSGAKVTDVTFSKVRSGVYNCRVEGMEVGDLSIRDGIVLKIENPRGELLIQLK
jgi:hypothetical protein